MNYGLIGKELSYSYSKLIHESLGLYDYELLSLPPENLPALMEGRDFKGLNVTIPYKRAVLPYCDARDPEVEEIGAANTLYFRDGLLRAGNTDLHGMAFMAARAGVSLAGRRVLILGGGGTSDTARALARSQGALWVRRALRVPVEDGDVPYTALPRDAEILINTTPVGCYPANLETLVSLGDFPDCRGVLDVIYNPLATRLVLEARERGIPCSGGLPMLVAQALKAAELFTGRIDLASQAEAVLLRLEKSLTNIVLVGMPGCGKSTLGVDLAAKLGRPFLDLDDRASELAGKPIPRIFQEDGEAAFRALESRVAQEAGKGRGQVLSTGGGVLLNPENVLALKQNGLLVFVDRPLHRLARTGRPLSEDSDALRRMEETRRPLYEAHSDLTVRNTKTRSETLEALLLALGGRA